MYIYVIRKISLLLKGGIVTALYCTAELSFNSLIQLSDGTLPLLLLSDMTRLQTKLVKPLFRL